MENLYNDDLTLKKEIGYLIIFISMIFVYLLGDYAISNNWDISNYKKIVMFDEAFNIFPVLVKMSVGAWVLLPYTIILSILKFITKTIH